MKARSKPVVTWVATNGASVEVVSVAVMEQSVLSFEFRSSIAGCFVICSGHAGTGDAVGPRGVRTAAGIARY